MLVVVVVLVGCGGGGNRSQRKEGRWQCRGLGVGKRSRLGVGRGACQSGWQPFKKGLSGAKPSRSLSAPLTPHSGQLKLTFDASCSPGLLSDHHLSYAQQARGPLLLMERMELWSIGLHQSGSWRPPNSKLGLRAVPKLNQRLLNQKPDPVAGCPAALWRTRPGTHSGRVERTYPPL